MPSCEICGNQDSNDASDDLAICSDCLADYANDLPEVDAMGNCYSDADPGL